MAEEEKKGNGSIIDRDSLGEYLRKIRIGNRVDIHKMAADTKLNLDYITAIEKNEFGKIPGETYRKIFIKNIARYLDLDPEETFQRYVRETQAPPPPQPAPAPVRTVPEPFQRVEGPAEGPTAGPAKSAEPGKSPYAAIKPPTRNIIIFLAAGIAVVGLLMLSQSGRQDKPADPLAQDTAADLLPQEDALAAPAQTPAAAHPVQNAGSQDEPFQDETAGALKTGVAAETDSVLVMAFRNGKLWTNIFRKGDAKVFASDTALYFNISGVDYKIVFKLNGELLRYDPKMGRIVRVAPGGITYISRDTWDRLVK